MLDGRVVCSTDGAMVPPGALALTRVVQAIQPTGMLSQQYAPLRVEDDTAKDSSATAPRTTGLPVLCDCRMFIGALTLGQLVAVAVALRGGVTSQY